MDNAQILTAAGIFSGEIVTASGLNETDEASVRAVLSQLGKSWGLADDDFYVFRNVKGPMNYSAAWIFFRKSEVLGIAYSSL